MIYLRNLKIIKESDEANKAIPEGIIPITEVAKKKTKEGLWLF